jgi:hypothetical protein
MSARQTGLEGTMMPPPPSSTGQIGSTAATGTANPLDGSALRALPPLPHPDLLGNITPATTLDLRRHLDHLSRLAEKIGQNGISALSASTGRITCISPAVTRVRAGRVGPSSDAAAV